LRTPASASNLALSPDPAFGADAVIAFSERDFNTVRQLIADYAGIKLSVQKRNMVYNRLLRRLRAHQLNDFGDYLQLVTANASGEREAFVNALTTNLTAFFREPHHFDLLAAYARDRIGKRRPLRCWSSACSTGEEAWSIAMVLRETGCPGEVLGTDIDTDVLETAQAAVYRMERTSGLPPERLRQHFLRGTGANDGLVSVRPDLRAMVRFGQLNLQSPVWPAQERFDVIFCRNVVIYFDREFQKKLLHRLADLLVPGGLLMVGHSESFPAAHPGFRSCGRTAYERLDG
jgi:chemotaxis protein methyltransferase CheR